MARPKILSSFYLYDPRRAEWLRIFDGCTLGQARGNDKFAIELEKSSDFCRFHLSPEKGVCVVDLGSPHGTFVNGTPVKFASEVPLNENDYLRINGRNLYLTRGKVLPALTVLRQGTPKPNKTPNIPRAPQRLPSNPHPTQHLRGAPLAEAPVTIDRVLGAYRIALEKIQLLTVGFLKSMLVLERFRETFFILALSVLTVGMVWRLYDPHQRKNKPSMATLDVSAQLRTPVSLEAIGHLPELRLPPPNDADTTHLNNQMSVALPPQPAHVEPEAIPFELRGVHPKPWPGRGMDSSHPSTPERIPASTSQMAPHFSITAVSVMTSAPQKTTFEGIVSPDRVVNAFEHMNQRSAASTSRNFHFPKFSRQGVTFQLDRCLTWETHCGKPAADAYCREMGMHSAIHFELADLIGDAKHPTAMIGEAKLVVCPGNHPSHPCDGFASIECE